MFESIPNEWLRRRTSVAEAEAKHMVEDPRLGPEPIPFGFSYREWQRLRNQMQERDELWEFSSSGLSWENLCGRAGIAVVRNGEVVNALLTMVS